MNEVICFSSPVDNIAIHSSINGITSVILCAKSPTTTSEHPGSKLLLSAKAQVLEYFACKRFSFDLPLDWSSIDGFRKDVLTLTNTIPYGEVWTYGKIAKLLGKPNASRAVGGALSSNPLPIIIPCHRVVSASGALTGYTGANGIATKQFLLEIEGRKIVDQKLV